MREDFKYTYTRPSLDWFETVNVEIKIGQYEYFILQRRFGNTWWIMGFKNSKEVQIGSIDGTNIFKFIDWCKNNAGGSRILHFSAISTSFNILEEIVKLYKEYEKYKTKESQK